MKKPSERSDEAERLKELYSLDILFTPSEERFDRITRLAKKVFDVPIVLVSLVGESCQWFKSNQGLVADRTSREVSFCAHAVYNDEILIVPNACQHEDFADNPLVIGEPNIRFYAGCPIRHDGYPIGTLCLIDTQPRALTADQTDMLESISHWVEAEIKVTAMGDVQKQLIAELGESRRDAMQDPMTKTWNRMGLDVLFGREINYAKHSRQPLTLMLVDIDRFKEVNDKYGHIVGDQVLKEIVARIRAAVRPEDIVSRFGGDEFVVLATNCSEASARNMAERIVESIDAKPIRAAEHDISVTLSIGLTSQRVTAQTSQKCLSQLADKALYQAKSSGRNQVCAVTSEDD
ncbi:sensor domain-containing diguanylate cyclase [Gilvimarinus sp. SDUM040013]|uniref:diguanylate cyclase n=1 Tax=Gilvimarinus gilvus TaxID=3058038 RepID=A0ABU4S1G1_9GAMM|nr:sensor domain-containing diguanylate cyclase [Gilvimarinus sp. SDUM040013]MDO3388099.1 sensor domain-containing diguanylate cyclase [Gilvimarinus sp. SDUM040013]MDX6850326.1 sensor domain-containing diguanylate cyclase [Gilvimarinus sp. SDUM040013]